MASTRPVEKDAGRAGRQANPTEQGRPKRARRPSLKVLEGVDGSGSSVEAVLPSCVSSYVSSYVSSGSSLLTIAGEENDTARVVPEMGMYTGLYLSHANGNAAGYSKQGIGTCPSKQGSNEQEGGVGEGKRQRGRSPNFQQPRGVRSSLIGSMTDVKFPVSGSEYGGGGRSGMDGREGNGRVRRGHKGVADVCQGIGKLQEYYGSHQAYYMESMTHLISAMSHKAQQMVLQGESLSSMRMKEALDAVATANAIIWRASAGFGSTTAVGNAADAADAVDPVDTHRAAVMVSPPAGVVAGGGETCAVGKDGDAEQALDTLA